MRRAQADDDRSLRDGNGRAARLARWLEQLPANPKITHLALEWKSEGEWVRVQLWPRGEVTPLMAVPIDAAVTELANELGQYLTARVVWLEPEASMYWTEHALRVHPEDMEGQQAFDGSAGNVAIQTQRALERMLGQAANSQQQANTSLREGNAQLLESNRILGGENNRLREDLYKLRDALVEKDEEIARLSALLERACEAAELAAQRGREDDHTGQVLQLVGKALGNMPQQPAG